MATNTTNYGFKKPDESDFYDVADQNKNWDLADKILKNLDTPTFEDYTGSTAVPSATDAIDQIKSKGKLGALLANIKAAFKGACLIGHIVNNCVTDNAGLPLSAAQGKVLMDKYTQLYSDLSVEISDLTHLLNQKYHDATAERYLRIYRVGHIKILSISFKANALTGHDIIATDIPETLLPSIACYAAIQGRDTGGWASATYAPVILGLGGKSVIISTGDKASKVTYISGTVTYI